VGVGDARQDGRVQLIDLPVPDSAAAVAAREVAMQYCSTALLNHSVRAYLWGVWYARDQGIAVDEALLYVAAMLHDLGLVDAFDSHRVDFEYAGGHVAWVFAAGAGWPVRRRERAAEIIVAHMLAEVDPAIDPEGHVLEVSTGIDISGPSIAVPSGLRAEVLAAFPRAGLAQEFTACFADQAARKPASTAAAAVRSGLAERIVTNPLDAQE